MTTNTTPSAGPVVLAQVMVLCERQGIDPKTLRGTLGGLTPYSSIFGQEDPQPFDLSFKVVLDQFEYQVRNKMKVYFQTSSQHCREVGMDLAHELAIAIATAKDLCDRMLARDLDIDDFAPRIANLASIGMRFFEEIAKVRALRRMWARMMKERYGARNPRSMHVNISLHSSGTSLVYQQPLNNIVRGAIECLAGGLAGCTAFGLSTYDEPHCEPTEQASRIALCTEYIVNYESGATDITDPLGGSYYVESLTNKLEEDASEILDEIERMGGLKAAIDKGWHEEVLLRTRLQRQRDIDNKERIVIGVNELVIPSEEEDPIPIQEVPESTSQAIVERLKEFKASRNVEKWKASLQRLYENGQKGEEFNLMPSMIEAVRNNATIGEIWGTIRMVNSLTYDPFDKLEPVGIPVADSATSRILSLPEKGILR